MITKSDRSFVFKNRQSISEGRRIKLVVTETVPGNRDPYTGTPTSEVVSEETCFGIYKTTVELNPKFLHQAGVSMGDFDSVFVIDKEEIDRIEVDPYKITLILKDNGNDPPFAFGVYNCYGTSLGSEVNKYVYFTKRESE